MWKLTQGEFSPAACPSLRTFSASVSSPMKWASLAGSFAGHLSSTTGHILHLELLRGPLLTPHFIDEEPGAQGTEVRKWRTPRAPPPRQAPLAWKVPESRPGVGTLLPAMATRSRETLTLHSQAALTSSWGLESSCWVEKKRGGGVSSLWGGEGRALSWESGPRPGGASPGL